MSVTFQSTSAQIVLLFPSDDALAKQLSERLEGRLSQEGFSVFRDHHPETSLQWARQIAREIQSAHFVIAFLSEKIDEMLLYQIEIATALHQGKTALFAISLCDHESLPEPLFSIVDGLDLVSWKGEKDNQKLLDEVIFQIKSLNEGSSINTKKELTKSKSMIQKSPLRVIPQIHKSQTIHQDNQNDQNDQSDHLIHQTSQSHKVHPIRKIHSMSFALEPIGGAVPLGSEFYIRRVADKELREAILRQDGIILIKGARQIGKTSILARGLQLARERGAKVALTDFQKFNSDDLSDLSSFYIALLESLSDQLELEIPPAELWDECRSANVNFERYIRREVLKPLNAPLVWGLDEIDRIFTCEYATEIFALFRSWHNERALDPSGLWAGLTLGMVYATEAHLFITDLNQSPFNVGTRLLLEDFSKAQIEELNQRYGSPINSENEMKRLHQLVAGHPFLVRKSLHEIAIHKKSFDRFVDEASCDEGIFGDHLRRILILLARDVHLTEIMRGVLRGEGCATLDGFYRLRSSGILIGRSPTDLSLRCELYETFLKRHLLS